MQVEIDVTATTENGTTTITARSGDQEIRSTLLASEITSIDDLAAWLLAQRGRDQVTNTDLQKRLTIDYHIDQITDPETGQDIDQTVIDSVASEPLPADDGRANFAAMPGWATWTAAEASSWIETNVVDLASAKTALLAMAKAIIYLRNVAID